MQTAANADVTDAASANTAAVAAGCQEASNQETVAQALHDTLGMKMCVARNPDTPLALTKKNALDLTTWLRKHYSTMLFLYEEIQASTDVSYLRVYVEKEMKTTDVGPPLRLENGPRDLDR